MVRAIPSDKCLFIFYFGCKGKEFLTYNQIFMHISFVNIQGLFRGSISVVNLP